MTTSRTITVLGSTGSVGMNTLNVIREHSGKFRVRGLAAGSKLQELTAQIEEFSPESVYLHDEKSARELRRIYGRRLKVFTQSEGLDVFTAYACSDILMVATSGTSALLSVIGALREGKRVALANKEILVAAGGLVMSELKKNPTSSLIPVDSEHSAIFQCLVGNPPENIERLILTGSGGPLREILQEEFQKVSKEVVTSHPRWKMGQKISVDSATLMNKGLEIIEASWLFGLPVEKIDVLIHPEAVIHSMVEFKDGAILAQLGVTDMRLPIQYALTFPERYSFSSLRLDWSKISTLNFMQPDHKKFPCLDIARQAARQAGSAPCVLSAADEAVVGAYLQDQISFLEIPRVIEKVMARHAYVSEPDLAQIQSLHTWATEEARRLCQAL